MPRKTRINTVAPATKQVWEYVARGTKLLIIDIQNEIALCALMDDEDKLTKFRVRVPLMKFVYRGNRGFLFTALRAGKLPKANWDGVGIFDARKSQLGARGGVWGSK